MRKLTSEGSQNLLSCANQRNHPIRSAELVQDRVEPLDGQGARLRLLSEEQEAQVRQGKQWGPISRRHRACLPAVAQGKRRRTSHTRRQPALVPNLLAKPWYGHWFGRPPGPFLRQSHASVV